MVHVLCSPSRLRPARERASAGKLLSALLVVLCVGFAVVAIVINSVMASPFDFKFWRDSLAQVAVYRWATPAAMTAQGATHLLVSRLLIGVAGFPGAHRDPPQGQSAPSRSAPASCWEALSSRWRCCKARWCAPTSDT